jgi:hypothetical protein
MGSGALPLSLSLSLSLHAFKRARAAKGTDEEAPPLLLLAALALVALLCFGVWFFVLSICRSLF